MHTELSTVADLRRTGHISSLEIVAAIDAYMQDPTTGPYRFATGYSLDIPALVAMAISPEDIASRPGPQEKAFRVAVAAVVMAAHPTPP
jgi:hypothetical protein